MANVHRQRLELVWLAVAFEGGLAVLAWFLGWLLDEPPLTRIRASGRDILLGLAAALPMLLLFYTCVRWPIGPLRQIKKFSDEIIQPWFRPCSLVDLAVISLAAGLGEELLFRGVVQDFLIGRLSLWAGIVFANVLFGLLHWITPTYALLAGLMGVYLSCVRLQSENLLVVIVAHASYDYLALWYLVRHGKEIPAECLGRNGSSVSSQAGTER
jgi:membrane protease YdiL (CAAX protease family)